MSNAPAPAATTATAASHGLPIGVHRITRGQRAASRARPTAAIRASVIATSAITRAARPITNAVRNGSRKVVMKRRPRRVTAAA
jgi:hypothetical protein